MNRSSRTATAAGIALGLASLAAPAHAAVVDHWNWSDEASYTLESDVCGFPIDVQEVFTGRGLARTVSGTDIQRVQLNTTFHVVWKNPANGLTFTLDAHSMFQERNVRHLQGDLWAYDVHQAGVPFDLRDDDGNVVLRDRGLITFSAVFDAATGETVSFDLDSMSGPHPGFGLDLCVLAQDLIG